MYVGKISTALLNKNKNGYILSIKTNQKPVINYKNSYKSHELLILSPTKLVWYVRMIVDWKF